MPKYSVCVLFTGSKYVGDFEAATEAEAIEMGLNSEENNASLCHQCSGEIELDDHCAHEGVASLIEDEE